MKYLVLFTLLGMVLSAACSTAARVDVQNTNAPARDDRPQNTIAHDPQDQAAKQANSNSSGKWSQSGDPIDTSKFDKAIEEADKAQQTKPSDAAPKTALAKAYFERGFALTEARQYASALGDYRKALKLDPDHAEAKKWEQQIINIYQMLKKEPPKAGEEPPPLPFQKPALQ